MLVLPDLGVPFRITIFPSLLTDETLLQLYSRGFNSLMIPTFIFIPQFFRLKSGSTVTTVIDYQTYLKTTYYFKNPSSTNGLPFWSTITVKPAPYPSWCNMYKTPVSLSRITFTILSFPCL